MAKAYPQFVNYFDMAKETVVRCDEERPRFHAFLKVRHVNSFRRVHSSVYVSWFWKFFLFEFGKVLEIFLR